MAAGSTYTPIASQTLTSTSNSITFSSIAATYTDLILMGQAGNSTYTMNDWTDMRIRFNSDTGSNYSFTELLGSGSVAVSTRATSATYIRAGMYAISNNSNYFSSFMYQINNYSNTTTYKTLLGWSGIPQGNGYVDASIGLWRSTSAINSITVLNDNSWPYMVGTTLTLYGIAAA